VSTHNLPFVPPAPAVFEKDLPLWRFLWNLTQSTVAIWPNCAFEALTVKKRIMGREFLIANDPLAVRHVLITNPTNYRCPTAVRRVARPILGTGLVLADGDDWRRQRRLLAAAFTPASVNLLLPHFQAAGLHMLHSIGSESKVNLSMVFRRTAWEVVFRALFSVSKDGASERLNRLAQGYLEGPGRANLFDVLAKSENAFAFSNRSRERFENVWFTTIEGLISERQSSGTDHRDLLDLLLSLKDADTGEPLSKIEIRDQCATMLVAGSETTGRLMFWAIYLLTQDIEEQANSRAEIAAFPPGVSAASTIFSIGRGCATCFWRLCAFILPLLLLFERPLRPTRSAVRESPQKRKCGSPLGSCIAIANFGINRQLLFPTALRARWRLGCKRPVTFRSALDRALALGFLSPCRKRKWYWRCCWNATKSEYLPENLCCRLGAL